MAVDEAIVLVGGLGTRLRATVSDVPKPLAPVAGRPFLAWVLDHLAAEGMRRVVLATGYMSEQVERAIGGEWTGMQVVYSIEEKPLGTGGAIRLAANLLQGDGAHVMNGDTFLRYSPAELERATSHAGAWMGMALAQVADVSRYGALRLEGASVVEFQEKGKVGAGCINAGCYFLTSKALQAFPARDAFSFETEVLRPLVAQRKVAAFMQTDRFVDIGVPEDYSRAQTMFDGAR